MDWFVFAVQWAHVLLGILWFGTVLSLDVIVIPAINRLPIVTQRDVSAAIGGRATPLFQVVVPPSRTEGGPEPMRPLPKGAHHAFPCSSV